MNCKPETYKRLGDYIRQIDERNSELSITTLLGLSMTKEFRPSTSNIVGTDLSKYKIVREGKFAFDTMSVIRVHKVPICYNNLGYPIIISPAYITFEIIDENLLNPLYLKLLVNRSEFDRYADFKSDSAVRGGYNWEELCETYIPVPNIEEQQRIVNQYNAIQKRIENNQMTIAKLEETAQAIYRKIFVDDIDPENLPEGWRMGVLSDIADYMNGVACQKFETKSNNSYPVIKIREINNGDIDNNSDRVSTNIPSKYIIQQGDLLFSWSASLSISFWSGCTGVLNQHIFKVTPKEVTDWYCYFSIKRQIEEWNRIISAKAVSMGHIKREDLDEVQVIIPNKSSTSHADHLIKPIFCYIMNLTRETKILSSLLNQLIN